MNICKPDVTIRKYALRKPHCTHVCGRIVFAEYYLVFILRYVSMHCVVNAQRTIYMKPIQMQAECAY